VAIWKATFAAASTAATQPPWRRPPKEILADVSLLPAAKWFVPGSWSQEAGIGVSSSVEKSLDWIAFALLFPGFFNFQASFSFCIFQGLIIKYTAAENLMQLLRDLYRPHPCSKKKKAPARHVAWQVP
jgi:hypothetical protein